MFTGKFYFSNYVYLKYITLKRIRKILTVLVLRLLLTCKFLNFIAVFNTKKLNSPKFVYNFPCEKTVQTVKINDHWTFLIFFVFTLFFMELKNREGWVVQRFRLCIWVTGGHKLTDFGTRAKNFDPWLISQIFKFFLNWQMIFFRRWLDDIRKENYNK